MKFKPENPISAEEIHGQIRSAAARGLPQIPRQKEPRRESLIIVATGPSLKDLAILRDLRRRKGMILALNGAHDFLLSKGIVPWGMLMYDPQEVTVKFVQRPRRGVTYFFGSQCHPNTFDAVAGYDVRLWHANVGTGERPLLEELYDDWCLVAGGSTVGTRAFYVGLEMGFRTFHVYGMDSCLLDGESHVYDQARIEGVAEDIVTVKSCGKTFTTYRWLAHQAEDFAKLLAAHGERMEIQIHGGGLLAAVLDDYKAGISR